MKSTKYIFDIENPCHESWDKMTANEAGKFCDSCTKTVIDFTKLSDSQIIKIIQKSSQNVCGRMREDQLHREMYPIIEKTSTSYFYKILASFLLFFGTIKSYANKTPKTQSEIVFEIKNTPEILDENSVDIDTNKYIFKGQVLDSIIDEPLFSVLISHSNLATKTDVDGEFTLQIPDSLLKEKMVFEIACIGYQKKIIEINKSEINKPIIIKLKEELIELNGEIMITKKGGLKLIKK